LNSIDWISKQVKSEGYQFVYVHHRSESPKIREKIAQFYSTRQYQRPLELAFIDQPRPTMFLGHFSSALFTLSRIYPNSTIKAFLFKDKYINGTQLEPKDYTLRVQQALVADKKIEASFMNDASILK
jgi:hypothetical protein